MGTLTTLLLIIVFIFIIHAPLSTDPHVKLSYILILMVYVYINACSSNFYHTSVTRFRNTTKYKPIYHFKEIPCTNATVTKSPMERRDKLWSFCTFCHPEAVGPMTCGEPFGPALFHLLSSSGGGPDDMRGTIWCHTFSPFVIQRRRVWWHAGKPYSPAPFFHYPETIMSDSTRRQIMVIRTLLLSVRLDAW